MEDQGIIELYFQRSEQAIRETERKYGRYCASISGNILRNRHDAQECVNDTYLQTWNSIPPARPANFPAYLGKIVRNISLNRLKADHAKKRGSGTFYESYEELSACIPSRDMTEDACDAVLLRDCITRWLSTLPAEQRMVFIGRYWYFDSVSTIASRMGFSVSKVKMMLLRLRADLKEQLQKEEIFL